MDGGVPFERYDRAARGWLGHAASAVTVFVAVACAVGALHEHGARVLASRAWVVSASMVAIIHALALAAQSRWGKGRYFVATWAAWLVILFAFTLSEGRLSRSDLASVAMGLGVLAAVLRGLAGPVLVALSRRGPGVTGAWLVAHAVSFTAVWAFLRIFATFAAFAHPHARSAPWTMAGPATFVLGCVAAVAAWVRWRERRWHIAVAAGGVAGYALAPALSVEGFASLPTWASVKGEADAVLVRVARPGEGAFREGDASVPVARVPSAPQGRPDLVWGLMALGIALATVTSSR